MKRILLTGGSGFIGANLARRLLAAGHEVHLLMRPQFSDWRLRDVRAHTPIHVVDPTSSAEIDAALQRIKPAWVFHLAAHGAYPWQTDAAEIMRTNVLFTTLLARACVRSGVEIMVHTGTSSEYGYKDHAPAESEPPEPNSTYAIAKCAATQFCQLTARASGAPLPTLRLYSIYGSYEDPRRLFPTLARHALEKRWPPLVAPETSRDFVHVDDAVDALLAIARQPPADPGAIYNVGSGRQTSMRELVQIAAQAFAIDAPPVWNSMPPRTWDAAVWIANPARFKAELGWSPKVDLPHGLKSLAAWLQAEPARLKFYREYAR